MGSNVGFVASGLHSKLSFSMLYNANKRKQSHSTVLMGDERVLSLERASKKVATMIDSDWAVFYLRSVYKNRSFQDLLTPT